MHAAIASTAPRSSPRWWPRPSGSMTGTAASTSRGVRCRAGGTIPASGRWTGAWWTGLLATCGRESEMKDHFMSWRRPPWKRMLVAGAIAGTVAASFVYCIDAIRTRSAPAPNDSPVRWVLLTTEDIGHGARNPTMTSISHIFGLATEDACARLRTEVESYHLYVSATCHQLDLRCDWFRGSEKMPVDCNRH
jgi:hypothetical protein